MDRRTFIQGTTIVTLTASATSQVANALPSEFSFGGLPAGLVTTIFKNFGDGGFTCLMTDHWECGMLGVTVFRHEMREGKRMMLTLSPEWPLFDQRFKPRYEEVSLAVLAERMAEASPDDPTVATLTAPITREIGLIRYDLQEHVAYVTKAVLRDGGKELDPRSRLELTRRRCAIQRAWAVRLAQRSAEVEQLNRENPWEMPSAQYSGGPLL
jgi:hypothetical protein